MPRTCTWWRACRPAFRVNGEIILADEDALSEADLNAIAESLLNEQQKKKFEQEWELCISLLHPSAGRIRATFYRRNGCPEMSYRFCGDRVATREELGLPEKIDDLARRPNGLVLVTGPTGAGKTTTLNYLVDLINTRAPLQDRDHRGPHRVRAREQAGHCCAAGGAHGRALVQPGADPRLAAGPRCDCGRARCATMRPSPPR